MINSGPVSDAVVLAALLRRQGGKVTLTAEELNAAQHTTLYAKQYGIGIVVRVEADAIDAQFTVVR